jgi:hypothetical protein
VSHPRASAVALADPVPRHLIRTHLEASLHSSKREFLSLRSPSKVVREATAGTLIRWSEILPEPFRLILPNDLSSQVKDLAAFMVQDSVPLKPDLLQPRLIVAPTPPDDLSTTRGDLFISTTGIPAEWIPQLIYEAASVRFQHHPEGRLLHV